MISPSTEKPLRRGKHREGARWSRHNPSHADPQRGIASLLLPAWRLRETEDRPRPTKPGSRRALIVIDYRSPSPWTNDSGREPTIEIVLEGHDAAVVAAPDQSEDVDHNDDSEATVPRTDLIPPYQPDESSSLATLFGFGERRESYEEPDIDAPGDAVWNSLPTLADVAIAGSAPTETQTTIQRLWEATEDHEILLDLDDAISPEFPKALIDSRRFRKPAVIAMVVMLGLLAWAVKELGEKPVRAADARESYYADAAVGIGLAITPLQSSISLLPEAELSVAQFAQLTRELDVVDGVARSSATLASEALPRGPVVGSSLPIDELILPKRLLEQASLQALRLEQRIGDAVAYRLMFANAFDLPQLPDEASLEEIGTVGGHLSVALAETSQVLGQLPGDAFFARHRQEAFDLVVTIESAQVDYFAALRQEDTERAAQIRDAITRSVETLKAGLTEPLAATEAWADAQFNELRTVLAEIQTLTDS